MTQINYPDIVRLSPSGGLRLEIRSPDNDGSDEKRSGNLSREVWGGFQSDFTYTVYETGTGNIVWQLSPGRHSPVFAPKDAWVSDRGHVILVTKTTFYSRLFVFDAGGTLVRQFDVAKDLIKKPSQMLITSAGPIWYERSMGFFFQAQGQTYWSLRTTFGLQIVIEPDTGKRPRTREVTIRQREAQTQEARRIVDAAAMDPRLQEPEAQFFRGDRSEFQVTPDQQFVDSVGPAIQCCGLAGVVEALPSLLALERSTTWCTYTGGWSVPGCDKSTWLVSLAYVSLAKHAIRCLGRPPAGYSSYWLCAGETPRHANRIDLPERFSDLAERMGEIRKGMTRHQVVEQIGMPDRDWEYDELANGEAYTMRVQWDAHDRVDELQRLEPAWKQALQCGIAH